MSISCPNPNDENFKTWQDLLGDETARALWDLSDKGDGDTFYTNHGVFDDGSEGTFDPKLRDLFKQQIISLVNRRKDLAGETDNTKRHDIYTKMEAIKASIERLTNDISYKNIIMIAYKDLVDAEKLVKKEELTDKELEYLRATLNRLLLLNNALPRTTDKVSHSDIASIAILNTKTLILKDAIDKATVKIIDNMSAEQGMEGGHAAIIAPVKDISATKGLFLGLDTTNIPILNLMDHLFESVKRKTQSIMFTFNKEDAKIRKEYSKPEDFKRILDSKGRIITETKGEYFEEERDMMKKTNFYLENVKGKKGSKATRERKAIYDKKDTWYLNNNNYTLTQEGIDAYEGRLNALKESLTDVDTGIIDAESTLYIDNWILANSPHLAMTYVTSGKKVKGNSYWYRYLNASPKAQWINENYHDVKDTDLYKFVTKTITDGMKMIPHSMMIDLNSFDRVFNSITFDFTKENKFILRAAYEGIGDFMKDVFTRAITQDEILGKSAKITDELGREKRKLYPKGITELQQEQQFENPLDLVKQFYSLAVSYQHKSEVEPKIWLLKELLDEQKKIKTNDAGIALNTPGINEETGGLMNAKKLAMANILAELYGKRRVDVEDIEPTEKEKIEFRSTWNKWDAARKEALSKELPYNVPEPVLHKISGIKIIDAIVDYTRLNLLWLKPLSAVTNLLVGIQGNFLHAGRNKDFNDGNLFTAMRMLLDSTVKYTTLGTVESGLARKINNMSNIMGIAEESFLEDNAAYTSKIAAFGLSWQTAGEYIIANQIMIAKMLNEKIKNKAGEEKSLWEAFDDEGHFKTEEFGKLDESYIKKTKDRIREVRKQTQGDYQNVMQVKGTVAGRVLMLFRTWLPRAVNNRFGEQVGEDFKGRYLSYRDVTQSYVETNGMWKGMGMMAGSQMITLLTKIGNIPGLSQLGMKSLSELCDKRYEKELLSMGISKLDIENMRVNVRELQYLVYMSLIVMMLSAMSGDEPPDKETTLAINLGTRLYQDMSFFYSFNSATSITKDPIPIYKTIQDGYEFVGNAINYVENPAKDVYQRGRHEGESKTKVSAYKLMPGLSAYESTMNTMNSVFGTKPR